ncbi:CCA tRNA nucleotidyltransferase [Sphingomonas carotinifaciens]|uniref:CCA tRNA nucleotidyltransferase n=1 Tax=Sphingomonas carotinifaciens TaxID=1166323 RepID=A0A1G7FAE7_9SPHN|nr:CCA tRNA nucleotidyltransferase [Sphingomonas carotinifaciens]MBB4085959.1 poly(A) polymerase [Sphingomonas carotinifaciens]MWC45346.1 CCA tRNA nucleotidyltransferase [Sphingomonas carotinifaciens]SDE72867.1 poly(A) polymerase [Sphingomonas carotinifaciens]
MTTLLSTASWQTHDGLSALAAALAAVPGNPRIVGGAVRDTLLGIAVADIDLATPLPPEAVMERVAAAGFKAVPTGIAHGTITAVLPGGPVEVTTLRRDVTTDGRHAVVAFTDDWREDAGRRDFTMNALYADPVTGELYDYFDGLTDLHAGRVRFIGDPRQRIAEDHLRILRFFRFHARFGDAIDDAGLEACTQRANDLMALSRERIASELLKLLVTAGAVPVLGLMVDRGILRAVLPEIDSDGVARLALLAGREAEAGMAADAVRRLAALVPAASAESVGARLKLSNTDRKRLVAATQGPGEEGARALAYRHGPTLAIDRLLLSGADPAALAGWTPPTLPIGGGALVERGLRKGPQVAAVLRAIETQWIAEGFPPAPRVLELADDAVAQALRSASIDQAAAASSGRA